MTRYRELFEALASPFSGREVKSRSQAGRTFHYITARTAMNRLDQVLGPENWWDDYTPLEHSVICRLSLRMPDGQVLTKADAGGYAGMADEGDDDKSGFSDAFKRAAVKFGVGRYLYNDGTPDLRGEVAAEGADAGAPRAAGPTLGTTTTRTRERFAKWIAKLIDRWSEAEPLGDETDRRAREFRIAHALITEAGPEIERLTWKPAEAGKEPVRDPKKIWEIVHRLAAGDWEWTKQATLKHLKKHVAESPRTADEPRDVLQGV